MTRSRRRKQMRKISRKPASKIMIKTDAANVKDGNTDDDDDGNKTK